MERIEIRIIRHAGTTTVVMLPAVPANETRRRGIRPSCREGEEAMTWIIVISTITIGCVVALGLCHAARLGDEISDRLWHEKAGDNQ